MSLPIRETANRTATIWPVISDPGYGDVNYGTPYTVTCTVEIGSSRKYIDDSGTEFVPKSRFWYEFDESKGVPALNDHIALGDHTAQPDPKLVSGVELIRMRTRHDESIDGDIDDIEVMT